MKASTRIGMVGLIFLALAIILVLPPEAQAPGIEAGESGSSWSIKTLSIQEPFKLTLNESSITINAQQLNVSGRFWVDASGNESQPAGDKLLGFSFGAELSAGSIQYRNTGTSNPWQYLGKADFTYLPSKHGYQDVYYTSWPSIPDSTDKEFIFSFTFGSKPSSFIIYFGTGSTILEATETATHINITIPSFYSNVSQWICEYEKAEGACHQIYDEDNQLYVEYHYGGYSAPMFDSPNISDGITGKNAVLVSTDFRASNDVFFNYTSFFSDDQTNVSVMAFAGYPFLIYTYETNETDTDRYYFDFYGGNETVWANDNISDYSLDTNWVSSNATHYSYLMNYNHTEADRAMIYMSGLDADNTDTLVQSFNNVDNPGSPYENWAKEAVMGYDKISAGRDDFYLDGNQFEILAGMIPTPVSREQQYYGNETWRWIRDYADPSVTIKNSDTSLYSKHKINFINDSIADEAISIDIVPNSLNNETFFYFSFESGNFSTIWVSIDGTECEFGYNNSNEYHNNDSCAFWNNLTLSRGDQNVSDSTWVAIHGYKWTDNTSKTIRVADTATDSTSPAITFTHPANETYNNSGGTILVSIYDANLNDTIWSTDAWATNSTTFNISTSGWSEQEYEVQVWANDTSGNMAADTFNITIDDSPPQFTSHTKNATPNEDQDIMINVTITDTVPSVNTVLLELTNDTYTINYSMTNSTTEWFLIVDQGNYTAHDNITWFIYADDIYGNLNRSYQQEFTVDNQAPSAPVPNYPSNNSNLSSTNVSIFNWTHSVDSDAEDTIVYYILINGTINTSTAGNYTAEINFTDGEHNWTILADDNYTNATSGSFMFIIDTANPQIDIDYPVEGQHYGNATRELNFTLTDANVQTCILEYYNASNSTQTLNFTWFNCSNITFEAPANMNQTITFYVNDTAGNANSSGVTFVIDQKAPTLTDAAYNPSCVEAGSAITYRWTQRDQFAQAFRESYCNFTAPGGAVTQISASTKGINATADCSMALTTAGTWTMQLYVEDQVLAGEGVVWNSYSWLGTPVEGNISNDTGNYALGQHSIIVAAAGSCGSAGSSGGGGSIPWVPLEENVTEEIIGRVVIPIAEAEFGFFEPMFLMVNGKPVLSIFHLGLLAFLAGYFLVYRKRKRIRGMFWYDYAAVLGVIVIIGLAFAGTMSPEGINAISNNTQAIPDAVSSLMGGG